MSRCIMYFQGAYLICRKGNLLSLVPGVLLSQCRSHPRNWCRLRAFSEGMGKAATAAGEARGKTPLVASTTLAAYATAFAAELDLVERKVVWLQDTFAAQSCANTGEASDVSLAALDYASQVACSCTTWLVHIKQAIWWFETEQCSLYRVDFEPCSRDCAKIHFFVGT